MYKKVSHKKPVMKERVIENNGDKDADQSTFLP